jgi:hypothetical protein
MTRMPRTQEAPRPQGQRQLGFDEPNSSAEGALAADADVADESD